MSEDDTYELAEPDDEPTPPPPPKPRPPAAAAPDPQPIELDEPAAERPAAKEKRPTLTDDGPESSSAADEPMAVSPAKARQAREDQRRRAAQELAEADARKKKLILIVVGTLIGALVLLWLWFKLF